MNDFSPVMPVGHFNDLGNRPEIVADRVIDQSVYEQLIRELKEVNRLLEVARAELQAQNTELKDRVEHLTRKENSQQSRIIALEERVRQLTGQIANMPEQILEVGEQRRAIQERVEVVGQQGLNLGDQLHQIEERDGHLLNEVEDVRAKYEALAMRTAEIKNSEDNLKAKNEYLNERCKRLEEKSNQSLVSQIWLDFRLFVYFKLGGSALDVPEPGTRKYTIEEYNIVNTQDREEQKNKKGDYA